jgi:hypothetical protein
MMLPDWVTRARVQRCCLVVFQPLLRDWPDQRLVNGIYAAPSGTNPAVQLGPLFRASGLLQASIESVHRDARRLVHNPPAGAARLVFACLRWQLGGDSQQLALLAQLPSQQQRFRRVPSDQEVRDGSCGRAGRYI